MAPHTGPRVLLGFSCGKDSIGAWIQARRYWPEVLPFYREIVPKLEFVEESLAYYERKFGQKIVRVTGAYFWSMLYQGMFQSPDSLDAIEAAGGVIVGVDNNKVADWAAKAQGLDPKTYWTLGGWRRQDSIARAFILKRYGPVRPDSRTIEPVYDWSVSQLADEIRGAGLKLPRDYKVFGRSFDGIRGRFLVHIKREWPRDYQRILDFFPMAEMECRRFLDEPYR